MPTFIFLKKVQVALILVIVFLASACGKSMTDIEYLQRAKQFQSKGDIKSSLIELKNALQQNPKNSEARLMLGELYLNIGDGAASEKELNNAQKYGVNNVYIQKLKIKALLLQRRYDDALSGINQLDNKDDPELLVLQGEALKGLGKHGESEKAFQRAIDSDPKQVDAFIGLSRLAFANEHYSKAKSYSKQALTINSQSPDALLMQAKIEFSEAEYTKAVESYQTVLQTQPKGVLTRHAYQAQVGSAYSLLAQNKLEQALPHVEILLKANPKHIAPKYLRALIAFKKQDYKAALDYLQPIMSDVKQGDPAQLLLGAVDYILGSYEQADLYLGQYVNAVPTNLYARKLYGATRLKLNQPDKAMDVLSSLVTQNHEDDASLLAMIGSAAAMKGDYIEGRTYLKKAITTGGDKANLRTEIAQTYMAEGDVDRAIKELEKSITESDNAVRPKVMLVFANIRNHDLSSALRLANELLGDWPNSPTVLNLVGSVHLLRNEISAAKEMFTKALEISPKYIPAQTNLAGIAMQSNNIEKAREYYDAVLKIDAKQIVSLVGLARIADMQGDHSQALKLLEQARQADAKATLPRLILANYYKRANKVTQAEAIAAEAVSMQPTDPQSLAVLANLQLVNHKPAEALSTYQKLQSIVPESPHVFLGLGNCYLQLKRLADAREAFRHAHKADPKLISAVVLLARVEMQMGNSKEAMRLATDLQKQQPKSSAGYVLSGDLHMMKGSYQQAVNAYKAAADRQASAGLTVSIFMASRQLKFDDNTLKPLSHWLTKHPEDRAVRLVLAGAYQELGENQKSIQEYKKLLKDSPDNPHLLNNLAWLYGLENKPEALDFAEKAYQISSDEVDIADTYGWLLVQQGKPGQGAEILKKALADGANEPEIHYHLAAAMAKSDDKAGARKILTQLLAENKPFSSRADAEKLYKSIK